MNISILHLYPREMNLYGDHGNVLTLKKRCQWRNINVEIINYEAGQTFPSQSLTMKLGKLFLATPTSFLAEADKTPDKSKSLTISKKSPPNLKH